MEFVEPIRDKRKIDAMKKVLRGGNMRDYCLFVVGINSGLRISDLLGLTVGDVITNAKADARGKVLDRITLRERKTGKSKDFPLSDNARKAIAEYLDTRQYTRSEPLFISRKHGAALQRAQAWKVINDAARAVGIKDRIGTHTLRKTFAYHAYKSGRDITLIMRLLNHASPATTLRYIGITRDQLDDVYLTINL
jgi:integrase